MLEQLISILKESKSVVISTHTRPDGDAIGSQIALGLFLVKQGKTVSLINHDPAPFNMDWLPGSDRLEVFDGSLSQRESISAADVIVIIDTNTEDRLGDLGIPIRSAAGTKVLVDHHTSPESWFDLSLCRESASSSGELVYEIIGAWNPDALDFDIAVALYVAIMTDTGSFRYSNVSPSLHRMVADLLERGGLDVSKIHDSIFDRRSPEVLALISRVLETARFYYDSQIGSLVISRRVLNETRANVEHSDGFANYILSVEGVRVALLFTETVKGTKVSFRSKGEDHVHTWAQAFGGGGHKNASGAFLRKPLEEAMEVVVSRAPRFVDLKIEGSESGENLSPEDSAYLNSLLDVQTKGPAS